MSQLRKDPLEGRWIIISSNRLVKPLQSAEAGQFDKEELSCPFCAGNEAYTPPEIYSVREKEKWLVRVFSNNYPALRIEGDVERAGHGIYDYMNGVGAHEIIAETPEHKGSLADLDMKHYLALIKSFKSRLTDLEKDLRLKYIMVFKNKGYLAGAHIFHSHSQLIAVPVIPKRVKEKLEYAKSYFRLKERCIYCDVIKQEKDDKVRIIDENDKFISFMPFASTFPFELMVLPKKHRYDFKLIKDDEIEQFASILKRSLLRIKNGLSDPAYNFILYTIPNVAADIDHGRQWETIYEDYHWHLEIIPRLTNVAGFEWGSGFFINPTPPEESAEFLRNVEI